LCFQELPGIDERTMLKIRMETADDIAQVRIVNERAFERYSEGRKNV
jgi:predicted N-acetyltransferase YhbS